MNVCRAGARPEFDSRQQRQQLLALAGSPDDGMRADAAAVLGELDEAVRLVWDRVGATHGFLAWDEATIAGLAVAQRRYPWKEIVDCVVWSAERLAVGALSPQYFATTFRGNGFCARYSAWQEHKRSVERSRRIEAEREAAEASRRSSPELDGDELHTLAAQALESFAPRPEAPRLRRGGSR